VLTNVNPLLVTDEPHDERSARIGDDLMAVVSELARPLDRVARHARQLVDCVPLAIIEDPQDIGVRA
jgi:hypothetical protein